MRRLLLPLLIAGLTLLFFSTLALNMAQASPAAQATATPQRTATTTRPAATATRTRAATGTRTPEADATEEVTATATVEATETEEVTATATAEITETEEITAAPTITIVLDPPILTDTAMLTESVLPPAFANPQDVDEARTLEVVGQSEIAADPDLATMTLAVDTIGVSVEQAVEENQEILADVLEIIEEADVPESAVRLRPYAIAVEAPGDTETTRSFRVSRQMTVRIDDLPENLEAVQQLIDGTGEVGTAIFRSLTYARSDDTLLRRQARGDAIEDALANAEDLAALTGVELVGVASISEVTEGSPGTMSTEGGSDFSLLSSVVNYEEQVRIVFYIR